MASVELRKLNNEHDRPTRQDMQGSNKLDYDADIILFTHNDYQINNNTNLVYDENINGEIITMPYIEVNLAKNKVNGRLENIAYKYNSHNMKFTQYDKGLYKVLRDESKNNKMKF